MVVGERYEVEEELGQGRLSVVYRARDRATGQVVALKVLQAHLREQASVVQRFRREMAAVQRLDHSAIVRVFDIVETPEHLALVMEYAPGVDLKSWVRANGAMASERVVRLGAVLLEALEQAHARGVLHRDLSLANVILEEGAEDRIEIIGFGLARVDELVGLTMHTRVLGTLETMAPECVLGRPADARADIYSVGAMLYELLVGQPLHDGRMNSGLQFAARADYLDGVREALEKVGVGGGLQHAVLRALAPDLELRFATAGQMRGALFGAYDEATWTALETYQGVGCPKCEEELVEGVGQCVYCGYRLKRLLRDSSGGGDYLVAVLAPGMTSLEELRTDIVGEEQVQALEQVLLEYEDVRHVFRAQASDRIVPFVLFENLAAADAARVTAVLKAGGVPCALAHRHEYRNGIVPGLRRAGNREKGGVERRWFEIATVAATLLALPMLGWMGGLALGGGLVSVGYGAMRFGARKGILHAQRFEVEARGFPRMDDRGPDSGVRIPAMLLSASQRRNIEEDVLPRRATAVLRELKDAALRREYHQVLVFTARLFRDPRVPSMALQDELEPMLQHTGALLKRLAELQSKGGGRTTAELFDALERLDARLAQSEDVEASAGLIAERGQILEDMARLDASVHEASLLRGHLLRVRAVLLDLQQRFGGVELPSLELVREEVADLRIRLEAEREVLELLEKV